MSSRWTDVPTDPPTRARVGKPRRVGDHLEHLTPWQWLLLVATFALVFGGAAAWCWAVATT